MEALIEHHPDFQQLSLPFLLEMTMELEIEYHL